jgi:hypothetical protein
MTRQKKFDMGTTRPATATAPAPAEVDYFVAGQATATEEEPVDRLNFVLPRRLRIQFNQEAAARDVKKQDLVREIFEFYFAKKQTKISSKTHT